jgi:hypothetical protein
MRLPLTRTFLALCLGLNLFAQSTQQQVPPEFAEMQAAARLADVQDRIKEVRRIKAAYPQSQLMANIDFLLLNFVTEAAGSLDKVLADQGEIIKSVSPQTRFDFIINGANMIANHPKAGEFPKAEFLKAIQSYKEDGLALVPQLLETIPENRRSEVSDSIKVAFEPILAKAQLTSGDAETALNTLEGLKKSKASLSSTDNNLFGQAYQKLGREKEALDAFMLAAYEDYAPAIKSARELYAKLNGDAAKFDEELENGLSKLPFEPAPFKAPENWKGKAVLVEAFTGSECPPCVAAGFAFDGLKETYPSQYLAILKYHVPIPGPDPMMNPTTDSRMKYYNIRSAPTVLVEGVKNVSAGGSRSMAIGSYNRIKAEIDPLLEASTDVTIKATAALNGDNVKVDCQFSKAIEGADYHVALVQTEEKYKGGNGFIHHKMVVRDLQTLKPTDKATVTFNIPESEKAADAYLTEFEVDRQARNPGFKWPARQNKIDRTKLKAVVFVQDTESKQVHNAFVVDISGK